ncbi:MAG: hypothetical protein KGJ78_09490 [Alphaproteobacteria bacterium]|nr:hypothetical protein [Alphaproteobacteria bacterium]
MGTLIQVIFREGNPRRRTASVGASHSRKLSGSLARERGLKLWREREDLVTAVAYRIWPEEQKAKP